MRLSAKRSNVYSQNGEDGIISHLLSLIPNDSWCCEFGAWDGIFLSNTYNLVSSKGYNAVYIEANEDRYKDLANLSQKNNRVIPINSYVGIEGETSLDELLKKTSIPRNFDILSIDVDGIDYLIWQSFTQYRPKIVVIEINSGMRPDIIMTDEDLKMDAMLKHVYENSTTSGVNFSTCYWLGRSKHYKLAVHTGNMIFIDEEYEDKVEGLATDENYLQFFKR